MGSQTTLFILSFKEYTFTKTLLEKGNSVMFLIISLVKNLKSVIESYQ